MHGFRSEFFSTRNVQARHGTKFKCSWCTDETENVKHVSVCEKSDEKQTKQQREKFENFAEIHLITPRQRRPCACARKRNSQRRRSDDPSQFGRRRSAAVLSNYTNVRGRLVCVPDTRKTNISRPVTGGRRVPEGLGRR